MLSVASSRSSAVAIADERLVERLREGDVDGFHFLYRRHFSAAHAYALTCTGTSLDAHELTRLAFTQLLHGLVEGGSRPAALAGCVRLQLLECVRSTAVRNCSRDGEGFSLRFRRWVEDGARWPLTDAGQLGAEWETASTQTRCLVWHTVVERDDPALVARVTGLDRTSVEGFLAEAFHPPRQPRHRHAPIDRARPESTPAHRTVESLLPVQLLGWWPESEYLRAKRTIAPPMVVPPYLERAIAQARAASGDREPPPGGARRSGGRARINWVLTALAVGIVLGLGAGLVFAPAGTL